MSKQFYLTTPIYYVNAAPHIGHSYTTIAADTLARFMRRELGDKNVWFLTGTDEHGQKIQRAAQAEGVSLKDFVDRASEEFKELWKSLNISYDDFIRTTEDRHITCVQKAMDILFKKGDIFKDSYEGLYCTPCESFWLASQAQDNLCPDCKRPLEKIREENYFLNLAKYQDWLVGYIREHPEFIKPESRMNEVLSFLELNKLEPLCISRPKERLGWGIPLSFAPSHVAYVWFDALINYISAVGSFDDKGVYKSKWWPADLHLIGKDILRQHAIYWPIMLKCLNIEMPRTVFAHGWWMVGEDKMSKSRGNVINPVDMVEIYGIDVYRYFLLRDVTFGLDGNFSEEAVIKRFNSDLANDLGNLVYRTLTMAEKYFQGQIPDAPWPKDEAAIAIKKKLDGLKEDMARALCASGNFNFSLCLEEVWEAINLANKYVEETKPWNLAKENKTEDLKGFIALLAAVIRQAAVCVAPFMPKTGALIEDEIGGNLTKKGSPLFPRIEIKP